MEKVVKVTIEKAPEQIIVRNDRGAEWKYSYKYIDTSVSATAAAIAMAQVNATFTTRLIELLDERDIISFTLKLDDK